MKDNEALLTLSPESAAFEREAAAYISALLADKRAKGLRITTVDLAGRVIVENTLGEEPSKILGEKWSGSADQPEDGVRGHAA